MSNGNDVTVTILKPEEIARRLQLINLSKFSRLCKVNRDTLRDLRNEERDPRLSVVLRVSEALLSA